MANNDIWDTSQHKHLFSDEFISEISQKLRISDEKFVEKEILSATNYFLLHEKQFSEYQKPHHVEQKALKNFIKKSEEFKKSYENLVKTGSALPFMMFESSNDEFFENKTPESVEIWNAHYKNGTTHIKAIPNFLDILGSLAESAHQKLDKNSPNRPKKVTMSQVYETLVFNLTALFDQSSVHLTQGEYYKDSVGYNSDAVDIIFEIAQKINPEIKKNQIGNAIKNVVAHRNSR